MISSVRQSFLAGLLALLPLYITFKVLTLLFNVVDGVMGDALNRLIHATTPVQAHIPGLGVVCTGLIVVGIGWLMRMVFFKRLLMLLTSLLERIPLVGSLYRASAQIVVPFTDSGKLPFSKVVLAEYPMVGRHTMGLIAKDQSVAGAGDDRIVVFFPSNHLHLGYPVVLPRADVQILDMSVEDAVKFFVSCGVIGAERLLQQSIDASADLSA